MLASVRQHGAVFRAQAPTVTDLMGLWGDFWAGIVPA